MFQISFVYLVIIICTLHAKFEKKKKRKHACKAAAGELLYIPLLSVMTLHYHRLYQISSLAANLSLEDLKQLCREKPPSQVYVPTRKLI